MNLTPFRSLGHLKASSPLSFRRGEGKSSCQNSFEWGEVKQAFCFILLTFCFFSCQPKKQEQEIAVAAEVNETANPALTSIGKIKLSEYGFFKEPLKDLSPTEGIIPYALNSALFSDYAYKKRFIKISDGKKIPYNSDDVFDFPDGTVLIKNFYYPAD